MVENAHPIKSMFNVAVALVLAFLIICSSILWILSGQLLLPPVGGFIILVVCTYLYLQSSSARFYLHPNVTINIILICSYLCIFLGVWSFITAKATSSGLEGIFDVMALVVLVIATMVPGIILLATGLILLFIQAKSIK